MSAAAIIGTVVIFEGIFQRHVHEESEGVLFDVSVGCIDAVEFMPSGSCQCMEFPSFSFASQSIERRERLS